MKARVAVVTPLGTCVWEKTYYGVQLDEVISTADMQPGVYYLVLSTEEGKSTKPFRDDSGSFEPGAGVILYSYN